MRDGVAEKLVGVKEHPFTRGGLCAKVSHFLERTYSPDRLRHPLIRTGPKGEGAFRRVSWDEALGAHRRAPERDRRRARGRGGPALQLLGHAGAGAGRVDGPALLRAPGCLPPGADDLRPGRGGRAARGRGHAGRAAPRRPRPQPLHRAVGDEHDRHQPAPVADRAGSAQGRRAGRRDRSAAHAHGRRGRLARAPAAGHRRRARARADARHRGRGPARRRLRARHTRRASSASRPSWRSGRPSTPSR